jgi:hypothetical protein
MSLRPRSYIGAQVPPGGRLFAADMAPVLHVRDRLTGSHPAAPVATGQGPAGADPAWTDPLGDLAAAAGFQIESFGKLPLLHYIVAVRPQASDG